MKRYHLSRLRSFLAELERNNTKIPPKLETLLQSSMKACVATLGYLPRVGARSKLPFKAPHCRVCRKPLHPAAKPWKSNFGITYPLFCTNLKCSEQRKRKNYFPTKRKLVGKLTGLTRPGCPVPRDKCPECKKEGFETLRHVFQIHHPSRFTLEIAWSRRCPRKGCPQRPQHFREDGTLLPHRGRGVPLIDDPDRPTCQRLGCAGFGKLMARRRSVELVGFGTTKKYECTKGENRHVCYVNRSSGDQIEPRMADKAKKKAWKLDLLPLDMRQCPRQGCTIPLRLGPMGGRFRQNYKFPYGAKGKRLGGPRRFGEEDYRYLVCRPRTGYSPRGSAKQRGHGSVAVAFGSVKLGTFRFEVIPAKRPGRPKGMSQGQIELAERAQRMMRAETARASGKKKGVLGKVAAQLFPHEKEMSRYQKINKLLSRNRRRKKAYKQT